MTKSPNSHSAVEALDHFLEQEQQTIRLGERCAEKARTDFSLYLQLLISWGRQMDLVSPASEEQLFQRHFLDSYAATRLLQPILASPTSGLVDVGSGAGFPGMVMAILQRQKPVYLVEPREKRCHFLAEVKRKLALENVQVIRARFEEVVQTIPQPIQLVISRALGSYPQFIHCGAELLKRSDGGFVSALVGPSFRAPEEHSHLPFQVLHYRLDKSEPNAARGLALWKVEN